MPKTYRKSPSYPLGTPLDDDPFLVNEANYELYEQPFGRSHNRSSEQGRIAVAALDGDVAAARSEWGGY